MGTNMPLCFRLSLHRYVIYSPRGWEIDLWLATYMPWREGGSAVHVQRGEIQGGLLEQRMGRRDLARQVRPQHVLILVFQPKS